MENIDWERARRDVERHLQALIAFDTTNPPGNELPCIEYIAQVLCTEGYEPVILESAPGRGNVVTRFNGTGERDPLLIYSHVDVVPAEAEKWSHPPFSGDIADGCVWGRGALDMKYIVAFELQCMLLLARARVPLKRDVIFAATADEESGGTMGAGWLVAHHPDLLRAEYALSEGAGSTLEVGGKRFYGVRTAEKATSRFRLVARGVPGHGSIPRQDTAVHKLSQAVDKLYRHRLPLHPSTTASRFVRTLSKAVNIEVPERLDDAAIQALTKRLPVDLGRTVQAVVRNTATPTGLRAGSKINVIPSEAEATVDGRLVPGQSQEDLFAEVRAVIGPDIDIDPIDRGIPQEVEPGDDLYQTIEDTVARHDPDATVIPLMLSGATDARWIATLGTRCLGFGPLAMPTGFSTEGLVHGHDERVPISGLGWGVQVFYEVVRDFALKA